MSGRTRVFIATSLDGFIAGPGDDLSWLPEEPDVEDTFTPFFAQVGAMLMGRRTYDVVTGMSVPWPYGETPVLVTTRRPISDAPETVRAVSGEIGELIEAALEAAKGKDVYLDGGDLIRQALDANLIDEMNVTVVSKVLGRGVPLFAGCEGPHELALTRHHQLSPSMIQLTYVRAS
jgi:dihydrofolate reductase